jgi:hypothetical protein
MLEKPDTLFSNQELEIIGWDNNPVSSSNLTVVITSLRKKITPIKGMRIKNIPRKGYLLSSIDKVDNLLNENKKTILTSKKNKPIKYLSLVFHVIILIISITLIAIPTLIITTTYNFSCEHINKKTICYIGDKNFSTLNLLDHIKNHEIMLKTPENTIILDSYSNIIMRIENEKNKTKL